jgi:hypothetical protein
MVEVRLPIVPRDASPLATGLGGAGAAVGGFMQAEAFVEQRKLRQRQAEMEQQALDQRGQQIELANRRQDAIAQRYLSEREAKANEARQEQQQRGDVFGVLKSLYGGGGPQMGPQPADPMASMPDEWAQEIDTIGQGFRDGTLTASQTSEALKLVAANKEATLRRVATQQLTDRLTKEIASGSWKPEAALGLQMDVDGDGQPDPISDTPQLLLRMLGEGKIDPAQVEAMHFAAKQAIDNEKARIVTREKQALKAEMVLNQSQDVTPEGERLAIGRIAAWRRDEYPQTQEGLEQFQRDFNAAKAGMVPLKGKSGQTYYVSEAEAREAELDLKPRSPFAEIEEKSTVLSRFLGEYKDDPELDDEANEKRWQMYRKRMIELDGELFRGQKPPEVEANKPPDAPKPEKGMTRAARARQLMGGTPMEKLTVEQKAAIARQIRSEFGNAETYAGGQ